MTQLLKKKSPGVYFLSGLSGFLLALSFPKFSLGFLAWISLIPFLIAVREIKSPQKAAKAGFWMGIVFFGVSIHWIAWISGWALLTLIPYQATFFSLVGFLLFYERYIKSTILRILYACCVWVFVEFLRSEIPILSFGWNLLGYSQANYSPMIQIASVVGVYSVGAQIIKFNFLGLLAYEEFKSKNKRSAFMFVALAVLIPVVLWALSSVLTFQDRKIRKEEVPQLKIGLTQGNIPQDVKWSPEAREQILQIYSKLTELSSLENPDLIIWPEASFPGYFNIDYLSSEVFNLVRKTEIPLLLGILYFKDRENLYNSALLIGHNGEIRERYDKMKLVPFGEYVPFQPFLSWLQPVADGLGIGHFKPGNHPTLFHIQNEELAFGTLICFEDIFPEIATRMANDGARFLVVITNDAWFGPTGAPYQHLQASIFRAIENGVAVVRSSNTGISAFISSRGKVLDVVRGRTGKELFETGQKTLDIPLFVHHTLYRQGGWLYPYVLSLILILFLPVVFRRRKREAV